jgi:hypothetical protein
MTQDDYRQQLLDIAHRLTLLATGEEAPPVPVPLPTTTYPRVETIAGAQFYLRAPLNPHWQPSQYARMFGARQILPDPSNATGDAPLRSPAGYPMYYPSPGVARVLYAENTYANDAEVESFRSALAQSQAGAEQRDRDEGNVFKTPGETEVRVEQG